jgi:hypothetical protein
MIKLLKKRNHFLNGVFNGVRLARNNFCWVQKGALSLKEKKCAKRLPEPHEGIAGRCFLLFWNIFHKKSLFCTGASFRRFLAMQDELGQNSKCPGKQGSRASFLKKVEKKNRARRVRPFFYLFF